jgi:hypothetical protein
MQPGRVMVCLDIAISLPHVMLALLHELERELDNTAQRAEHDYSHRSQTKT